LDQLQDFREMAYSLPKEANNLKEIPIDITFCAVPEEYLFHSGFYFQVVSVDT